jgi:lipopolysaccharide/colanic/teichoic acid biosynthesis glycosyltransferase
MTRMFGMIFLPEMLFIWIIELVICYLVFYALLDASPFVTFNIYLFKTPISPAAFDAFVLALTVGFVGIMMGLYRPETCLEMRLLLLKATISSVISLLAVWAVAVSSHIDVLSAFGGGIPGLFYILLAWGGLLVATRLLYILALRTNLVVRHVAVLGSDMAQACATIARSRRGLFRVEAMLPQTLDLKRLPAKLWAIVHTGKDLPTELPAGVRVFDFGSFSESQLGRIDLATATNIRFERFLNASAAAETTRRILDVVLAVLLLLMTAPVLCVTALLIRVESPGTVFYRQERVGLNGRTFTLWKFRSMRADAERLGPAWASLGDARVTAVGRIIRKVRIDELPQLLNILRGDMSLVGPRPERPHFVEQLSDLLPLYRQRSHVKPGLTGWAQVNYPYGASVEDAWEKLAYDLYYVKHRNLLFDFHIILATVRVILFQEGSR